MLRYFLLHTTKQSPVTKNHFLRLLVTKSGDGELANNTYIQAIRRLRAKINQLKTPNSIIDNYGDKLTSKACWQCN